ncbi:hypothetical protein MLD38_030049 [Melastoma candidum]|uniref:Uncharacterized protein n=1 Tax=Melastoma candidum TaxID=119954 RepID=A0ACB9MLZ9_9MYRT|nr:hypothetical protein MLD38_030049 [Melastoma candidum]
MVFLKPPSRKRSSSFVSPLSQPPPKSIRPPPVPAAADSTPSTSSSSAAAAERLVSVLADAGCTLVNGDGPPCLPSDAHKFRARIGVVLGRDDAARGEFLRGFSDYVRSEKNLRRVLASGGGHGFALSRKSNGSLARNLLLVPCIQLELQKILLEKLPEYFEPPRMGESLSLGDDIARLIINQFRWLDFIIDADSFTENLMQLLSICPLHLKKEIVGSLPEIIGDKNHKSVVDSLEQMLQEDSGVAVPVLDCLSNLQMKDELKEQVIDIALSCIRTIDIELMPFLLRMLLLSATPANVRKIFIGIREQLKFFGASHHAAKGRRGKAVMDSTEASILDTLRLGMRFKNILCQEFLREFGNITRPQEFKSADLWLINIMNMNGGTAQKSINKIFKKKIVEGCIPKDVLEDCLHGHAKVAQDYFPSFLSLSEYLLASKEQKAREFSMHLYMCLFEEFDDKYSRQELIGSLVTHIGCGINVEVSSALETMSLLADKYAHELVSLSSHINGILDYLEAFSLENIYKVYELFSHLALSVRCNLDMLGSSFSNELLMIVRKQVSHHDINYKKMGLIGTLKIVCSLGDVDTAVCSDQLSRSNCQEALELLGSCLNCCKHLPLPLIIFYDEISAILEQKKLHLVILEWVGKHAGEFESRFTSDLDRGRLPETDLTSEIDGELWMNLDGDISPICVNILPLACSSLQAPLLQSLPANFLLLATFERFTNQGSLGGIDALLGCPLYLPSPKFFAKSGWQSLPEKKKQILCLCLYHADNWIRELLNAFCTQIAHHSELASTAARDELITKLHKRFESLVFIECLLNNLLEAYPSCLPETYVRMDHLGSSNVNEFMRKKNETKSMHNHEIRKKMKHKKLAKSHSSLSSDNTLHQPTIESMLEKAKSRAGLEGQSYIGSCSSKSDPIPISSEQNHCGFGEVVSLDVSAVYAAVEDQRFKFRSLQIHSYSLFLMSREVHVSDPLTELPLYLYLARDLHHKLDYFCKGYGQLSCRSLKTAPGFAQINFDDLLPLLVQILTTFRRHVDFALRMIQQDDNTCRVLWDMPSDHSENPLRIVVSMGAASKYFVMELFHCIRKTLEVASDISSEAAVLSDLLCAFQPVEMPKNCFLGIQNCPLPKTLEYLYCGACSFLEDVLDIACSSSFVVASESLFTLESLVFSAHRVSSRLMGAHGDSMSRFNGEVLSSLDQRLGTAAEKILKHEWDTVGDGWKSKGETIRRILHTYLGNKESTLNALTELACSILPQVSFSKVGEKGPEHGFPTLCSATHLIWYRVLHEVNLTLFNGLVKEVGRMSKVRTDATNDKIEELLLKLLKSVNIVVSLVNVCRIQHKVTVHSTALKYSQKFIDSFLKVFEFLEVQFEAHSDTVIQLVQELQKATRTLQTLCSEAKGLKLTAITSKIPATKRTLERLLFRVKALLHTSSSGCTFWMGNLKHKDLAGQVVSSQAYLDDQDEKLEDDDAGVDDDPEPVGSGSSCGGEE